MAAKQCPYLAEHGTVALLVQSAPLYGVIGTPHEYTGNGVHVLAGDDVPVPYGAPPCGGSSLPASCARSARSPSWTWTTLCRPPGPSGH